jgi:predicted P-loop ATPase/GTPase
LDKPIVILGDLNCDVLKHNCPESKALINFAKEMNLSQLIKSPTRFTNTTQSLLDVVLVSSNSLVRRSGVLNTTRKYMHAETLALLTKPLYFLNMKYLK